jgi:hypothetical protein
LTHPDFLCPECGSHDAAENLMVSQHYDPSIPHSGVLQYISCAACRYRIPAHLAERWDGITDDEAASEWRREFRNGASREAS